ncbi:hypothetical protein AQUCO_00700289v1 [Aquilegia coerulea]|uniref:TLC domain-containing protein n=1 Tax=Aquilegia coerulea TaxID=218851 RepID=A0A2G5EJE5_AQUCA|nr:hypothetical protein AQUCO_00700289v1 [Aquilegia coerulea]
MEDYIVRLIVLGVISWSVVFLLVRKIFSNLSFNSCNRIVSTIHAALAVTLASLSVQDWRCPVCPAAAKSSHWQCGSEMVAALWITEISSPFLHMRELLKELGYKDTDANLAADFAFAVIFSLARMIGGPYLAYVTVTADNPILIKAMALGLLAVSVFWFYKIARMVRYKLIKRSGHNKVT